MHSKRHGGPAILTWHMLKSGGLFIVFSSCFPPCVPWRTVQELCWAKNQTKHSRKGWKTDEDTLFLHSNAF